LTEQNKSSMARCRQARRHGRERPHDREQLIELAFSQDRPRIDSRTSLDHLVEHNHPG